MAQLTIQQAFDLAMGHFQARRLREAEGILRQILVQQPRHAGAMHYLGLIAYLVGQNDSAVDLIRKAIAINPNWPQAQNNLGSVLKDSGQLDEAIAAYRQTIALDPNFPEAHSNLIYVLHFHPDCDVQAIAEEHLRWEHQHAEPLKKFIQPHGNDRNPERRLRIGYVSPDLRGHPIGRFLLPLVKHHNREQFEVHCYSDVRQPDAVTARLKENSVWHDITGVSHEMLAKQIRLDGIDILMDLTLHMAFNRLLVFARKPAPVQVSWLGYIDSNGLGTMDYRLSDPYIDPPGSDADYGEKTLRIPCYWCYEPLEESPPPAPPPALKNGHVTFGSFNSFCKVNPVTLKLWSEVLQAMENSRLLIHAQLGSHRDAALRTFAKDGVDPSRITFVGLVPPAAYLLQYSQIDIALDTTPYVGGTTTCDAMWMGVPTVTLSGKTAIGRGGVSMMSNVGLPELIAWTPEEYVKIATNLAKDLARLQAMRSNMRQRMEASPLMDGKRFAESIEAAYRQMWRTWCEKDLSKS